MFLRAENNDSHTFFFWGGFSFLQLFLLKAEVK